MRLSPVAPRWRDEFCGERERRPPKPSPIREATPPCGPARRSSTTERLSLLSLLIHPMPGAELKLLPHGKLSIHEEFPVSVAGAVSSFLSR